MKLWGGPMKFTIMISAALFIITCMVPICTQCIPTVSAFSDDGIFTMDNPIPDVLQDSGSDAEVVRHRFAGIQAEELSRWRHRINLNLFEDVRFTAERSRTEDLWLEHTGDSGFIWVGVLADIAHSQVILVVMDGTITGNIVLPGGFYQIRYVMDGIHEIRQIDQSRFPDYCEPVESVSDDQRMENTGTRDDPSSIDVMVVYTQDAAAASGNIVAEIQLAVAETNQSYLNSDITQRLTLVQAAEIPYVETGNSSTDLYRLQGTTDGYLDEVHGWRNTYYADLVCLIVEDMAGYCGRAFLMQTVSHSFESYAFSVVARSCATGYFSFGHELGHNMGAHHDHYVNPGPAAYPFSYGFVNVTDQWRTIMAYNTECSDSGVYCTRIQYWSNPNVYYGGDSMGVPAGQPGAADNHLTLDMTAYTVANFRNSPAQIDLPSMGTGGILVVLMIFAGLFGWMKRRG